MAVQVTLGHFSALPPPPTAHPLVLPTPSAQSWSFTLLAGRVPEVCEVFDEKAISKGHPASMQQGTMWEESQLSCESCPALTSTVDMEREWWHETE